ncbi:TaqI-like C-terminal specificity domain-containing protein [Flavobacterium filum]|uniref:TaqI-like C-terminal specificity domain-containing protein n=1 Tax=Flavobacterium filum TaxID=370974 RepID=UPI00040ABEAF|nr:TaqI-like C-terminal specificity domain-containing protein [Flavobacterium filum]
MRSNYGKSLRKTLLESYNVTNLIDFSDYPVFESATVLTNIIFISKQSYQKNTNVCLIEKNLKPDYNELKKYLKRREYIVALELDNPWSITSFYKFEIRNKLQLNNPTLKELGYSISNGFRTGFNEAYIIDEITKNKLIESDLKNQELIKPLIRGRDIRKYDVSFENLFVIIVANGKGNNLQADYPYIFQYLLGFEKQLKNRGQVKNGQHHWLELDNHPNEEYLKLFEIPKITYPEITKFLPFYYDLNSKYYSNNKTFFINGNSLELLVSYLNSKLFKFAFLETFPELQGNSRELRKVFMEQIPFKLISEKDQQPFIEKVDQILALKKDNPLADTSALEREIDWMVYGLYGLSEEEITIVENS